MLTNKKFIPAFFIFALILCSCSKASPEPQQKVDTFIPDNTTDTTDNNDDIEGAVSARPDDSSTTSTTSESQNSVDYTIYDDIITEASAILFRSDKDNIIENENISSIFYTHSAWDDTYEILGYTTLDLDGNGVDELIFGENAPDAETGWDGIIYDIYTISNNQLVHVLDGWERNRYYLCEDGTIANESSGSAFNSSFTYYSYTDSSLKLKETVVMDGYYDEENPWFYSTQYEDSPENSTPISEDEAQNIIQKYTYKILQFTPFQEDL